MGSIAESMVADAVDSLMRLDADLAMKVILRDDELDNRDIEIENICLRMLALQSPTGTDLRMVGTAMKMITDLERIGDLAVDISKAGLKIRKELGHSDGIDLRKMATICQRMLRMSLESFVKRDLALVQEVIEQDDQVDQLYRDMRDSLLAQMRMNADEVVTNSWLLLAVHHLERVADHAVNIAERVSFFVTGQFVQLRSSHRSSEGANE